VKPSAERQDLFADDPERPDAVRGVAVVVLPLLLDRDAI
jgi:hypothetical protein